MRQWICLAVAALGLSLVAGDWSAESDMALAAPISPGVISSTGLITHVQELDGKLLRVIVIDPAQQAMGVYDVSRETGEIQPKSIRNISADLRMLEFNSGGPSPADIKNSLERK